ncbi:hypothetical protein [Halobacillus karajensis]|uniref:Uncharacterized protein n=1 Tax=Halobacillus karajensis TaxID=195088 RepID=A0A059NWP6_9BACI|nr:hypothetical protein [Halobacillus karajensis]CDQ18970.1 hypothetical protein BN982_01251 [Halobacillus karajensis]CDQ22956.1 hypothetical protein BN983_01175 [Halobacillus karajensis]CDQ26439.1 hypothetical protein BN981_00656 [Halobacillus karajensis]
MLKLASLDELYEAKRDLEEVSRRYPDVYETLTHVVSFTRQLQIKYGYMGALLMEEDLTSTYPEFVKGSILSLYKKEVDKLKNHEDFPVVKEVLDQYRDIGDAKLFLLILGAKPELLKGSTIIK